MKSSSYFKRTLSFLLVLALIFTLIPNDMNTPIFAKEDVQKGRFLVAYKDLRGSDKKTPYSLSKADEGIKRGEIISEGKEVVALASDSKLGIKASLKDKQILAIEEDSIISLYDDESEVVSELLISLDKYKSDFKGSGIKIALIDSGVNTEKTGVNLAGGKSFIDDDYRLDENGHGTSLAGIIKGFETSDGTKFSGLAQESELYSLKVLGSDGKGYYSDVIKALDWSRENNIDIVIMAFGADKYSSILHMSVQKAYFRDMLLVSASGNSDSKVNYPAAYTEVMAVGASFNDEEIVYNYSDKDLVEIYAQGKDINTVSSNNESEVKNGSSYSSAIVGAVSASFWSQDRTLNAREVRGLIKEAAKDLNISEEVYKLLDVKKAEELLNNDLVPEAGDYDSEINYEEDEEDVEVSALADFGEISDDIKMWEEFIIPVTFSHDHTKVVATLLDSSNTVVETVNFPMLASTGNVVSSILANKEYEYKFSKTYKRGIYKVKFYPYVMVYEEDEDGNIIGQEEVLQNEWIFFSPDINIYGSNLQIANLRSIGTCNLETGEMIDPISKEEVKVVESYEVGVDAVNVDEDLATDYVGETQINFYLIPNNNYSVEIDESLTKLPSIYQEGSEINGGKVIKFDDVDTSELTSHLEPSNIYRQVKGTWNPVGKEILTSDEFNEIKDDFIKKTMTYKVVCELVYDDKHDDIVSMKSVNGLEDTQGKSGHILALKKDLAINYIISKEGEVHIVVDGDPVDMATGNYTSSVTDMAIAGKVKIEFNRKYNSTNLKDTGLGIHNSASYNLYYEDEGEYIKAYLGDGHVEFYSKNTDGSYNVLDSDIRFVGYKNNEFIIEYKGNKRYKFNNTDENHFISEINDKGSVLNFDYENVYNKNTQKEEVKLSRIYSISGSIYISYDDDCHIVKIYDDAGRKVEYEYDNNLLKKVTNISGNTYEYKYDSKSRLTKLIDPYGNEQIVNNYSDDNKVLEQINEDGTKFIYQYFDDKTVLTDRNGISRTFYKDERGRIIKRQYQDGSERFVFDENNNLVRYFDKNANEIKYTYDENGNLIEKIDALSQLTKYTYNTNGDLIQKENPDGSTLSFSYDENFNIIKVVDELGFEETFSYDENNNLIESIRKDGSILSFTYDSRGNLKSESINSQLINTYDYDLVNRLIKTTNALGNDTRITYLADGSVKEIISPDGSKSKNFYDKKARLIKTIDESGNITRYTYNEMGSLLSMTSADSSTTNYSYDSIQNLVKTTFADGSKIENVYDNAGRLVKEIDELGNYKTYTYDNNGNIITSTDELGRLTSYEYDVLNRLVKTTNPLGEISTLTYRYDGKVLSSTDFAGKITSYEYDLMGRLTKVSTPDLESESIIYDELGNIVGSIDKLGRLTSYSYDDRNNLVKVVKADGSVLENIYDLAGNLIKTIDAMGYETKYYYDSSNRLIKKTNALGVSTYLEYDSSSNIIKSIDENGGATSYLYDSMNRLIKTTDSLGQSEKLEYDLLGRVVKVINKDGSYKEFSYDKKGRLISETDEEGYTSTYSYDEVGNVLSSTDKEGNITSRAYDELDRLISLTDPLGNLTNTTYDKSGNITSIKNALGQTTSYEYDVMGNLIKEISPLASTKEYSYDELSNLLSFKDENGNATTYNYDDLNRLVKLTLPDNTVKEQVYDKNSNVIEVVDALGNKKTYTYDALNRLIKQTDEEGISTYNTYTKTSKIKTTTDGNANVSSFTYDSLDRLVEEVNALGIPTKYVYDNRDNIIEIITKTGVNNEIISNLASSEGYEANEAETSEKFEYNARGELIKEISRKGYVKTYKYDGNGNISEVLDEDGFKTKFTYDSNANLIKKTITGGLMPELQDSKITYTYDKLNRLIKRLDDIYTEKGFNPSREYTYTYDELGNLASETDYEGKKTQMYYDAVGNLTTLVYPDDTTIEYTYDLMNRVKTVSDSDGVNTYTYDKLGRRTRLDFSNKAHEKYTYDKKGRTLSQVTGDKRNVTMTIHDYEYDNNDNIVVDVFKNYKTALIKEVTVRTYAYDSVNQLTTEQEQKDNYEKNGTKTKYYYDLAGNMIQKASSKLQTTSQSIFNIHPKVYITNYEYGVDNELLKQRGLSETIAYHKSVAFDYEYDKRGNLIGIKDPWLECTSKYVSQFYYDGMNKLRYSSDKQNKLTRYSYDGEGRRIFKESETILAMTSISPKCDGSRGLLIKEQIESLVNKEEECCMGKDFKTTQNFIYNPISKYDDIILTYGKNMHSQRFVYGAKDKDKGLIKVDSYQLYGQLWDENSTGRTYQGVADYHNDNYAKETFKRNAVISTYMIKDIRGSIEQQTGRLGYKGFTYTYTAFGIEKFPMNLNDIHGFAGLVRDRETDSYYANARMYLPQIHRFLAKDKLRVDSLNRYLYVVNNPVNYVDPSGLYILPDRIRNITNNSYLKYNVLDKYMCSETGDKNLEDFKRLLGLIGSAQKITVGGYIAAISVALELGSIGMSTAISLVGIGVGSSLIVEGLYDFNDSVFGDVNNIGNNSPAKYVTEEFAGIIASMFLDSEEDIEIVKTYAGITYRAAELGISIFLPIKASMSKPSITIKGSEDDIANIIAKYGDDTFNVDVKPNVSNIKLKNIVDDLYKGQNGGNIVGNGTTMDAVRNEIITGKATNGKFHLKKLKDYSNALKRRLRAGDLNEYDEMVAKNILEDILNALDGK